jgi:hypothetical protein
MRGIFTTKLTHYPGSVAAMQALLRAPSLALAGLIAVAAAALVLAGRGIPTPWILVDELLHAQLARGLRAGDGYSVRGHGLTVSWTYPALLAPFAWSYGAMKAVNAVVVALTAVPVFLWMRRLVSPITALAAAVLTLLLPSMLFSSTLMLENLFLPLFVTACFLCALAIERPTLTLQFSAFAAIALASATRVQGLLLVPVFALAAVATRRARALLPSLVVCAVVSVAAVTKLAVGGLGVYEQHRAAHYTAGAIATWLLRSTGELSLAAAIVPVAALLALRPRLLRERVFLAVAASATAALVCLAAVAAAWEPHGIKERYMAPAFPLLLMALVVWVERGARPRPWWAIALPAALAVSLPLGRLFASPSLLGNGWGVLPFERAGLTTARVLVVLGAAAAAALFLYAPRLAVVGVAVFLAASTAVVYSTIRGRARTVLVLSGLRDRDWIDDAGVHAVTYINATNFEQEARAGRWFEEWVPVWETEFWNHSALTVLSLGDPEPAPFFQQIGALDWRNGLITNGGGVRYAFTDSRFRLAGRELAREGRFILWKAAQPLRFSTVAEGLYADATTTGLAAYSCWTECPRRVRVTADDPHARAVIGPFAPLGAAGGRIVGIQRAQSVGVLSAPRAPFRIEVHARPGSHVTFAAA